MAATSERGAVLVVRAWQEPGVPGFRARIAHRVDATETAETGRVVDSSEQLHAVVQEWLDAFLARAAHDRA